MQVPNWEPPYARKKHNKNAALFLIIPPPPPRIDFPGGTFTWEWELLYQYSFIASDLYILPLPLFPMDLHLGVVGMEISTSSWRQTTLLWKLSFSSWLHEFWYSVACRCLVLLRVCLVINIALCVSWVNHVTNARYLTKGCFLNPVANRWIFNNANKSNKWRIHFTFIEGFPFSSILACIQPRHGSVNSANGRELLTRKDNGQTIARS